MEYLNETQMLKKMKGIDYKFYSIEERELMELSKEQMEKVIYELECNYNSKIFDDENLIEIINLFKNYLNSGGTK